MKNNVQTHIFGFYQINYTNYCTLIDFIILFVICTVFFLNILYLFIYLFVKSILLLFVMTFLSSKNPYFKHLIFKIIKIDTFLKYSTWVIFSIIFFWKIFFQLYWKTYIFTTLLQVRNNMAACLTFCLRSNTENNVGKNNTRSHIKAGGGVEEYR